MFQKIGTSKRKKRLVVIAVLWGISFSLSLAVFLCGALDPFENKMYDVFSRHLGPRASSPDVIIIRIDQHSIDLLGKEGITWPWPRQLYAPLVEYLDGAKAVFIDLLFTESSSYGQEDDRILAEAVQKAGNTILPVFLSDKQADRDAAAAAAAFLKTLYSRRSYKNTVPENSERKTYRHALPPIDALARAAAGLGNVTISADSDGIYRKMPLFFGLNDLVVPHFVLEYFGVDGKVEVGEKSARINGRIVHLDGGNLWLRYPESIASFRTFSAVDVLRAAIGRPPAAASSITKSIFQDKFVFIGSTAAGLYDLKPTPVSSRTPGVMIHAALMDNLLRGDSLRHIKGTTILLIMLAVSFLTTVTVIKNRFIYINAGYFILYMLVIFALAAGLFRRAVYIDTLAPMGALLISFMISVIYSYASEGRERRFITHTFSRYMDKKLVEYLLENPSLIAPGGQKKHMTVFFADIAGFTSISEKIPPEKTALLLHTALNIFTEVIIRNQGVIDKYIGDCIMAFWGSPQRSELDETNACRAALQCIESLQTINESLKADSVPEINIRIGIHSGPAIAGNLGSDRLFSYTVVGDTVNLASRFESVNKTFKTQIIVSEDTLGRTEGKFLARRLGRIEVKGKTRPVMIYELKCEASEAGAEKVREVRTILDAFHEALERFEAGDFKNALEKFRKILHDSNEDGPSKFFMKRCAVFMENPPMEHDHRTLRMTKK